MHNISNYSLCQKLQMLRALNMYGAGYKTYINNYDTSIIMFHYYSLPCLLSELRFG